MDYTHCDAGKREVRRPAFDKAGIHYSYHEYPGLAHEFGIWRKDLNDFAPLLFKW